MNDYDAVKLAEMLHTPAIPTGCCKTGMIFKLPEVYLKIYDDKDFFYRVQIFSYLSDVPIIEKSVRENELTEFVQDTICRRRLSNDQISLCRRSAFDYHD